jgi:hypothetical protein
MAVRDALSWDTMDRTVLLCHKCLEFVNYVAENRQLGTTRGVSQSSRDAIRTGGRICRRW